MVDLSNICGFTLKLDEIKGRIQYGDSVTCGDEYFVHLKEIVPALLNQNLKYPERVYTYHRNILNSLAKPGTTLTYDLIHIPYGLLGIEFMKTHVYYSDYSAGKYDCIVELLSGEMTVIIQRNEEKSDPYQLETYVEDVVITIMKPGDKIAIPTGAYYSFVNTGVTSVVFSKISTPNHAPIDYSALRREKGLAYYIISKNAKVEAVANPKYKMRCTLKHAELQRLLREQTFQKIYNPFESNKSLYNLFVNSGLNKMVYA